jgi:hypothetical protein
MQISAPLTIWPDAACGIPLSSTYFLKKFGFSWLEILNTVSITTILREYSVSYSHFPQAFPQWADARTDAQNRLFPVISGHPATFYTHSLGVIYRDKNDYS